LAEENLESYRAELEGIKAPLGVILFLIKRDNLNIYDIPIAEITRQYLGYMELMDKLDIELAGEFFVLAATLMRIKVQMLLRRNGDEEDPREDLVRSLLEYQKMVEAAKSFQSLEEERFKVFSRAVPEKEKQHEPEVEFELSLFELMKAFREIAANFEEETIRAIETETFTIEEKVEAVLSALAEKSQVDFYDLFGSSHSRLELIVTFLALLELIKRAEVEVRQEGPFGRIWLYATGQQESIIDENDKTENISNANRPKHLDSADIDNERVNPRRDDSPHHLPGGD